MSTPNTITIAGNLTAAPEFRTTSSEIPFTRMRIAVSQRIQVSGTDRWEDRLDGFFNVTCWRDAARHAHSSLKKGDRIVVHGRLTRREFEVKGADGSTETRQVVEIDADEVGGSFRFYPWAKIQTRPLTVDPATSLPGPAATRPGDAAADEDDDVDDDDVAPAA